MWAWRRGGHRRRSTGKRVPAMSVRRWFTAPTRTTDILITGPTGVGLGAGAGGSRRWDTPRHGRNKRGHDDQIKSRSKLEVGLLATLLQISIAGLRQFTAENAARHDRAQDLRRAAADREHARVADHALQRPIARVAGRAKYLERIIGHLDGGFGCKDLGLRRK